MSLKGSVETDGAPSQLDTDPLGRRGRVPPPGGTPKCWERETEKKERERLT